MGEWEKAKAVEFFSDNRRFRRAGKNLSLEYSWLFEDWVTAFDLFAKPSLSSSLAKGAEKYLGRRAAAGTVEGVERLTETLYRLQPYIEQALDDSVTPENASALMKGRYSVWQPTLLRGAESAPAPFKRLAEHCRKYEEVREELVWLYDVDIKDEDIHGAIRSVFHSEEEYIEYYREGYALGLGCVEYLEKQIGKAALQNPMSLTLLGSLRPLKKFLRTMGELEVELAKEKAGEIY